MSDKRKLAGKLKDKRYRDAFVASQVRVTIPFQVRALRAQRGWDQKTLAEKAGMLQPRISEIETPGTPLTLRTIQRIASGFDVGLIVRFAPFGDLIRFSDEFSPDTFRVPSFPDEQFASDHQRVDRGSAETGQGVKSNVVELHTVKSKHITTGATRSSLDNDGTAATTTIASSDMARGISGESTFSEVANG